MNAAPTRPTICLCMIVKDEVDVLEQCLDSCRGLIDHWVICDTGSTDGTQELVVRALDGTPGELHERPWVDFGHNRSELMTLARGKADYLLLLDADCAIDATPEQLSQLSADAYFVRYGSGVAYYRKTLVSGRLHWRFVGSVHEYVHSDEERTSARLDDVSIRSIATATARHGGAERDAELLERELERDPADARSAFYLAQTYRDLGHQSDDRERLRQAVHWYRVRAEMGGWAEEAYCAWRELGVLSDELGDWPAAVDAYLRGWELRPSRLEAVHGLTVGLRTREQHHAAHRFASLAANLEPLPLPADLLYVEPWIYRWGMLFEYSITAYWVEQYEASIAACRRLLEIEELPPAHREQTARNMDHAVRASVSRAALTAPPRPARAPRAPGTPTRGLRAPDTLTPLELRAPGLARRVAELCAMPVQTVDRRLLGLGRILEVTVADLAPWPLRVRPGTSDIAQLDLICNGRGHLPLEELRAPELILDLGAGIGIATLDLARRYPSAHLIAVEMDAANLELCAHNLERLGGRVTLVGAAIADTDGAVDYTTGGDPAHHAVAARGEGHASAITLDTLLEHAGGGLVVDYLKMSIEGSEQSVLRAGGRWPSCVRQISVVPYGDYDLDDALADLRALGFTISGGDEQARACGTREDGVPWRSGPLRGLARRLA
jgi:FkbM family methyltransferase